MSETPLESVQGWLPVHVQKMKQAWVTTAEQVVALCATEDGLKAVSEQLQVPEPQARRLVDAARATLSPAVRAEMDEPADTGNYGLGALPPRKEDPSR